MKSNFSQNTAIVSGAVETGNFKIAANGKAFKILIDGLYSNKIKAIIRELSSNAWDSQVSAKTEDIPFELKLPNILDPIFYVRDFGTSLSHDDIMGLYTTVFQSTKEDSNLSVGKFGLGSKTPFAYTDSFTVTAFMNGTKRVYGAYINTNGVPSISLITSEDTGKRNGLMVSFAVKDSDYERFRAETEVVLEHFDVMPVVKGATLNIPKKEVVLEGSNFKILKSGYTVLAKQGCVAYPIDFNNITKPWSEKVKSFYQTSMIIDFPIGELDITPSRETLSYDNDTINNITVMLEKVYDEIISSLDKEYKATVKTMYQAACFKHHHMFVTNRAVNHYIGGLEFNGKLISTKESVYRDKLLKNYNLRMSYFDLHKIKTKKTLSFDYNKYDISWTVKDKLMIVFENEKDKLKFCSNRILNNMDGYDAVLWVKVSEKTTLKQLKAFKKFLGYPDKIKKMENLERVIPVKEPKNTVTTVTTVKRDKNIITIGRLTGEWAYDKSETVDITTLPKDQKYLFKYRDRFYVGDDKDSFCLPTSIYNIFSKDEFEKFIVIGSKHFKKIKEAGFKNALTSLKDELLSEVDLKAYVKAQNNRTLGNHQIYEHRSLFRDVQYDKPTPFKIVLDFLNNCDKEGETDGKVNILFKLINYSDQIDLLKEFKDDIQNEKPLKEHVNELAKYYPLAKLILDRYYFEEENVKHLLDYIDLVDRDNLNKEKELN